MRNKLINVYCIQEIAHSVAILEPNGLQKLFFLQIKLSKFGHASYTSLLVH
jgi:hypothetical protein